MISLVLGIMEANAGVNASLDSKTTAVIQNNKEISKEANETINAVRKEIVENRENARELRKEIRNEIRKTRRELRDEYNGQIREMVRERRELLLKIQNKNVSFDIKEGNRMRIRSGDVEAETELEIEAEEESNETKLMARFSNGKNAEIKIMPDTAAERALERLRLKVCSEENNCTIKLRKVTEGDENNEDFQTRARYNVKAKKQARILGLFGTEMDVDAEVDAETGEVVRVNKPWWAFLASEN